MGKPGRVGKPLEEVRELLIAASVAVGNGDRDAAVWRTVDALGLLTKGLPPSRQLTGLDVATQRGFVATIRISHTHEG